MRAGNCYSMEGDDRDDYEPLDYFGIPPRGNTTSKQDGDVRSEQDYEDIDPVRPRIGSTESNSQNASRWRSSSAGRDVKAQLESLLFNSRVPPLTADKHIGAAVTGHDAISGRHRAAGSAVVAEATPPPIPPKSRSFQKRAATIARIDMPPPLTDGPSPGGHQLQQRFRDGTDSEAPAQSWSDAGSQPPRKLSLPLPPYPNDSLRAIKKTMTPHSSLPSLPESSESSVPVCGSVPRSHSPVDSVSTFKPDLVTSRASQPDLHQSSRAPRRSSAPQVQYYNALPHSSPTVTKDTARPNSTRRGKDHLMHEYTVMRPLTSENITIATPNHQPTVRGLQSQLAVLEENSSKLSEHTAGLESNLQQSLEQLIDHQQWLEGEIRSLVQQVNVLQSQLMTSSGLQTKTPASGPGLPPQEVGGASIGASSGSEELNKQFLASLDSAQVLQLLGALGLEQYATSFRQHGVDGEFLLECSGDMLRKGLRMTSQLHRLRLLKIIRGHKPVQQMLKT